MAFKNITITEDVYDRLRALKRENESFSDLLRRLTDPMEFAGSCPGFGRHVAAAREDLDEGIEETQDDLFG